MAAFSPAFGLMVWRAWGTSWVWWFGIPTVLGVLVAVVVVWSVRTGNPEPYTFEDISDSSGDVLGHVGSYLAVAIIDPKASVNEAILGFAVLTLILLVHISVGLVHVNPLFYILGRRVYTGSTEAGLAYYIVARSEVADWNGPQSLVRISDALLVEGSEREP